MSGIGNFGVSVSTSGNQIVDGLLMGVKWGDAVVTFSFPTGPTEYGIPFDYSFDEEPASFGTISATQQAAARWALDTAYGNSANDGFSIEGFTNLTISYTTSTNANLRYAESDEPSTAWAYGPGSYTPAGDIWFGAGQGYRSPTPGTYEWHTLIHETGHAMGLKHGHETDGNGAMPSQYDSMEYSIMTYRSYIGGPTVGAYTNEIYGFAQSYMIADIAALQHMYGADYTTNSGDTVYKWNPNSGDTLVNGQVAIDAGGNRIFATIWDGGGIDTYDLSAYSTNLEIDLSPGGHSVFSNVQIAYLGSGNYSRGNIFNALMFQGDSSSLIENAIGGSGNDTIIGNTANNTLIGGAGSDTLSGGDGADTLQGNGGNNTLNGDGGDDSLFGGGLADTLNGGLGDDLLVGSGGADVLNGGDHNLGGDTASYSNSNAAVTVNLDAGTGMGGHAEGDTLAAIENLYGSQYGDTLTGDSLDNILTGWNGNDTLSGGGGADLISGGNGNDTADYSSAASAVTVHIANVSSGTQGDANGDTFYNVENVTGSDFDDTLTGTGLVNIINGGDGNDTIYASNGNDTINGGIGDDFMNGGRGRDTIDGGDGIDTVGYANSDLYVIVDLLAGTMIGSGHAGGDILTNIENISGSAFNDILTGDTGANVLTGYSGNDQINGGDGNDTLFGNAGTDTLNGGQGDDVMYGGAGADVFEFTDLAFGQDTIIGWQNGSDLLDFSSLSLDFSDFTLSYVSGDTVLTLTSDPTQTLTLSGIAMATIDALDFV